MPPPAWTATNVRVGHIPGSRSWHSPLLLHVPPRAAVPYSSGRIEFTTFDHFIADQPCLATCGENFLTLFFPRFCIVGWLNNVPAPGLTPLPEEGSILHSGPARPQERAGGAGTR